MSDPTLLSKEEFDDYAPALLEAAKEIRAEGHNGWGNLCQGAAEYIVDLRDQMATLERSNKRLREKLDRRSH